MNLDVATLNVIFVSAPGVLCYFVLSKLLGRVGRGNLEVVMLIFLYAVVSYVTYGYAGRALHAFGYPNSAAEFVLATPSALRVRTADVAWASVAGVLIAFGLSYGYKFNLINRLGQRLRATNRAGDEDVWHFFHNATREPWSSEWIVVRDHKVDLQYFGAVSHWSESGEDRELLMVQVSVFRNSNGMKLYDCDHMYLCRNKADLTIEIHKEGRGGSDE